MASMKAPIRAMIIVRSHIDAEAVECFLQSPECVEVAELRLLGLGIAPFREIPGACRRRIDC
jgi:hypothetical protein